MLSSPAIVRRAAVATSRPIASANAATGRDRRRLPIKSRQRFGEARIGRRPAHHQIALRIDIDAGEQLIEMNVEITSDGAGDVSLEQQDQRGASNRQRHQDRNDAAGDQPKPQRTPFHAGFSGTM